MVFFRNIFISCLILFALGSKAACPTNEADFLDGGTFSGDCDLSGYTSPVTLGGATVTWTSGTITLVGDFTLGASGFFNMDPAATFNITGDLTINGTADINGAINVTGNVVIGSSPQADLGGNGYITYTGTWTDPGGANTSGAFTNCPGAADCGDITLPVELTHFTVTRGSQDGEARINWATSSELNNYGFKLEKSVDGSSWDELGFVEGFGTTTIPQVYNYNDDNFHIQSYYRLNQIDFDGGNEYSPIAFLSLNELNGNAISIAPNPVSDRISLIGMADGEIKVTILDLSGKVLFSETHVGLNSTEVAINQMLTRLDQGSFFIEFKSLGNRSFMRFIKN